MEKMAETLDILGYSYVEGVLQARSIAPQWTACSARLQKAQRFPASGSLR